MKDGLLQRLERIKTTSTLLEMNGKIDGKDGVDKNDGWSNIIQEIQENLPVPAGARWPDNEEYGFYHQAYENGWWVGFQERQKAEKQNA